MRGGLVPLLAVGAAVEGVWRGECRVSVVIVGLFDLAPFLVPSFAAVPPNPPPFSRMNSTPVASKADRVPARGPFSIFPFLSFA